MRDKPLLDMFLLLLRSYYVKYFYLPWFCGATTITGIIAAISPLFECYCQSHKQQPFVALSNIIIYNIFIPISLLMSPVLKTQRRTNENGSVELVFEDIALHGQDPFALITIPGALLRNKYKGTSPFRRIRHTNNP